MVASAALNGVRLAPNGATLLVAAMPKVMLWSSYSTEGRVGWRRLTAVIPVDAGDALQQRSW